MVSTQIKIKADFDLRSAYDSTQILVNNDIYETLSANNIPAVVSKIMTLSFSENMTLQLVSYSDQKVYSSGEKRLSVIQYLEPSVQYQNNFNTPSNDFSGDGFEIMSYSDFSSAAIHSVHNYADMMNYTYTLRIPIVVNSTKATFKYRDVAIVEPGESGSVYGDADFYDYVVVEGTLDGITWSAIAPGYDARYNFNWLDAFNNGNPGTSTMLKTHTFNLLNTFNAGDTILLRFRLWSDQAVNSWGWAIDDVDIQNPETAIDENQQALAQSTIFPNPTKGRISLTLGQKFNGKLKVTIYSLTGRIVSSSEFVKNMAEMTTNMDLSNQPDGFYMVTITDGKRTETHKINLIK